MWSEDRHPTERRIAEPVAALRSNHPDFRTARFSVKQTGRDYLVTVMGRGNFPGEVMHALKALRARFQAEFRFVRMAAGCSDFPMASSPGQSYLWLRRVGDMPPVACANEYAAVDDSEWLKLCWERCPLFCEVDLSCNYCGIPVCERCRSTPRMARQDVLCCNVCAYHNHEGIEFRND